jgi:lipoprotein-anchoring transpeptidase ErfK/SrfK
MGLFRFFRSGGRIAWILIAAVLMVIAASTALLANTAEVRYERDVTRMVFNDNVGVLEDIRKSLGIQKDSLERHLAGSAEAPGANQPYIVVSIEDHRLWYKQGDSVLFTTQVATGSGKILEKEGGSHWKFETPRGRLIVQSKEEDPAWVPPDWHFVEQARKRGLGLVRLNRGEEIPSGGGWAIAVAGANVVRRYPDGRETPIETGEDREIVVGGNIIIPPFGTNQRKYRGVLGTHRLNLGDGYALHGTNKPETVGRAVSHGCVRLRNEDIALLHSTVPIGTPVYIY